MKVHIQRLFALLMALVLTLGLLVFPASAAESPVTSTGTIWSSFAASKWSGLLGQQIIGTVCGSVCPTSDDALHHGSIIEKNPNGKNWVGLCSYCSQRFPVYDDDMQNAYDGRVGELPANGFTSDGSLLWYVQTSDLSSFYLTNHGNSAVVRPSSISELPVLATDVRWTYDSRHLYAKYVGSVLGEEWLTVACNYSIRKRQAKTHIAK